MDGPAAPEKPSPVFAWWLVLGLVGLDYFSTLAYLPSIAVQADRNLAPLTAVGVVLVTLLAALPVYLYVVGRSPHGHGAIGLLERLVSGWRGKVFILVLLGFVGTDFVVTRTLSVADAAKHVTHNPYWQQHVEWMGNNKETVRGYFPGFLAGTVDFWNEQLVLTLVLTILTFLVFAFVFRGFNRAFLYLSAGVVGLFLVVNGIVIGCGLAYLGRHPERVENWFGTLSKGSPLIVYRITDGTLASLREDGVPAKVTAELGPLKNREFANQDRLWKELVRTLDPEDLEQYGDRVVAQAPEVAGISWTALAGMLAWLVFSALLTSPQMILGLSGFELSMSNAPLVRGRPDDSPENPRGRIRRARWMLAAAALVMSAFVLGSVFTVSQLVPWAALQGGADADDPEWKGPAMHRALAYLAHGGKLDTTFAARVANKVPEQPDGTDVSPLFGPAFGTLYDVSTVLILCLAGASVPLSLRKVVPHYLARYGMELPWANRIGGSGWLFNLAMVLIILAFHASVSAQQWAYGACVLALLTGAAMAALFALRRRWAGSAWQSVVGFPFLLICGLFLTLFVLMFFENRRLFSGRTFTDFLTALFTETHLHNRSGLYIPLVFVLVVLGTAFASRWLRSTELRFGGFVFADEHSQKRWEEICRLEFQVLVPHRPGGLSLADKDREIRARHRLGPEVPILFVEAELGDPSDFLQAPVMKVETVEGFEVIRVSRCASIAHVLAAIGLEFRHVGRPPEIHFGWSEEAPLAANLNFLFFGEGNVPWMVHALIRKAEPDEVRRPRVVIG